MVELPPIQQVDEDYPTRLSRMKQDYAHATGTYPLPAHPETFLLEQMAYELSLADQRINAESRQNLLAEAQAERLDYLGDLLSTPRLAPQPARTQIEFTLSTDHPTLIIPHGTQVRAADGQTLFATTRAETVPAGQTSAIVTAACTTPGPSGNGFNPGEVNQLVSPTAHIIRAQNTIVSAGGSATETDDNYRARIRLAPGQFSTAGSRESYIYHTRSAHPDIVDADCWRGTPGQVHIAAMLQSGSVPDAPMLELIEQAVSGERVRPITDQVLVSAPEIVSYTIDLAVEINHSHAALAQNIQDAITRQLTDLTATWQRTLGQDIVPEKFVQIGQQTRGVYRAQAHSPDYQILDRHQIPQASEINVRIAVNQQT